MTTHTRRTSVAISAVIALTSVLLPTTGAAASRDGSNQADSPAAPQVTAAPALYPAFNPAIHYYVTRCANQPVAVSVTNPGRAGVIVDNQPAQIGNFSTSVPHLLEGQEFTISTARTEDSDDATTYHVRCLPSDFPSWTATRTGTTESAFYLVTPSSSRTPPVAPYVAIFDTNGVPRWWVRSSPEPVDAKVLADGNILWDNIGSMPSEHDLTGATVRTFNAAGEFDRHDIQILPNGNYLLAVVRTVPADLTPCGGAANGQITEPQLQEYSSHGTLLWSWDAVDHISLSEVPPGWKANCAAGDPFHFNSIDAAGNDVIVSFRHLDAVYRISTKTNQIVWKLGGTARSDGTSLAVTGDSTYASGGGFGGQHDARLLPDGTLSVHDNGTDRARAPRVVRYRINADTHVARLVEEVSDPTVTSSFCCGSATRLPDGNWMVAWGGTSVVEELTSSGRRVVFRLAFDGGVFSYRGYPITSRGWGPRLEAGMNSQHPRTPGG